MTYSMKASQYYGDHIIVMTNKEAGSICARCPDKLRMITQQKLRCHVHKTEEKNVNNKGYKTWACCLDATFSGLSWRPLR